MLGKGFRLPGGSPGESGGQLRESWQPASPKQGRGGNDVCNPRDDPGFIG